MKTFLTSLCAFLALLFTQSINAQTYVNHAATGNNDGSSWADAYTTLHDALENYSAGDEIWVATGTYLPGQASTFPGAPRNTFYIYQDVAIYGGFDGTETMLSERDPVTNVTILSGDLNGDDVDDDFETNREDNTLNVMLIDTLTTAATIIDGFTFEGGHADIDDDYFPNKRGGGIFTWGATQVSNCIFQQNYTIWNAGGIYFWEEGASGGRVENCLFRNNKCLGGGAGLFASRLSGEELVIANCQFENNEANANNGGGGAFIINSFASVNNCQFTNNHATNGGGGICLMYSGAGTGNQSMSVTNCEFQDNSAGLTGGGIYYFSSNSATGNNVTISNCQVTENTSANGGGFWYSSDGTSDGKLTLEDCEFTSNAAIVTPGDAFPDAAGIGFQYFNAPSQNDTIRLIDCLIQENSSEGNAGGVFYIHTTGTGNHLQMDNCQLIGNRDQSGLAVGGMAVAEGGESTSVLVRNSLFDGNSGPLGQGFGVSALDGVTPPEERHIELVNCLFTNHNTNSPLTYVAVTNREFNLTNCTFSENQAPLLGVVDDGKITVQNNIFQENGFPTYSALGTVGGQPIQSLGGNLISDDAMDAWLNNTDLSNTDPLFEMGTFQPSANSPAVDAGVLLGTPTATDLDGNDRIQGGCLDIGAIESPHDAGTACQLLPRRYVDQDATGNNDGSSWENAFTSLHDALEVYQPNDEIWVAEGTYLPQQPSAWPGDPKNTFYLYQNVKLYGGFNGTETQLSQRDPAAHETILSGDLNGDDLPGDFETNREDNATNLMFLTEDITPQTIIDGFTISGGHADGDDAVEYNIRGGGMWCLGSPYISNCRITDNYASNFGAGIYLSREMAARTVLENCVFTENRAGIVAGGLEIATLSSNETVQVNNCQFIENIADNSGGGLIIFESSAAFTNCRFSENESGNAAGAMYFFNDTESELEVTVTDCVFERNSSNHGGAFYHFSGGPGGDDFLFESCEFIANEATASPDFNFPDGGAMGFQYLLDSNPMGDSIVITDCIFQGNTANRLGGGIAYFNNTGMDNYFSIEDCEFSENSATITGGAVSFNQFVGGSSTGTQLNLTDNDFDDNTAANGGAVAFIGEVGEDGEYLISECDFDGNQSIEVPGDFIPTGGALLIQFSGTGFQDNNFIVEDCSLENNTSEFAGGGLFYYGPFGSDNYFEMNDCEVSKNSAPSAGGVGIVEGGTNNTALVLNTFFNQNESPSSMAAAVARDQITPGIPAATAPYTDFVNCVFANHDDELGSAVVFGVFGSGVEATLTNCTFASNDGPTLGTDLDVPGGKINLRNNILSNGGNPGYISGAAGDDGTINSLGGNLVTDNTLDAFLNSADQSNTDPLFVSGLLQLSSNSPAVDAGVLLDMPTVTDFFGNARIQGSCIDIGAAESSFDTGNSCLTTDTREALAETSSIFIYPNPVASTANISIENDWTGEMKLRIVNALGQTVHHSVFEKYDHSTFTEFDASDLPEGIYRVTVSNGEVMAVSSFVKL